MSLGAAFDAGARLGSAVLVAFLAVVFFKSGYAARTQRLWVALVRATTALALAAGAFWLVVASVPYPHDPGMPTLSIVATTVFVAGLAIEELVGADIRRLLGI